MSATSKQANPPDKGQAPQEISREQSELLSYLGDYALVNSTWNRVLSGYSSLKEYNDYLKSGMEMAENATTKVYQTTQPYLKQLDDRYHVYKTVDEKGVEVLKRMESSAQSMRQRAEGTRENARQALDATKERGTKMIERANRPINHLLDVTELLVDKILPPDALVEQKKIPEGEEEEKKLATNPLPRAAALSADVSKRVRAAAISQFSQLSLRSPQEVLEMTHVVDLIQYAAVNIDAGTQKAKQAAESTKQIASGAAESFSVVGQELSDRATQRLAAISHIVEDATKDVKEQSVKATVAVVATVAQASELVRRRILGLSSSLSVDERKVAIEKQLRQLLEKTKNYADSLTPEKLREYINTVNEKSAAALAHLLKLVNVSSSEELLGQLSSWTTTVRERIAPILPEHVPAEDEVVVEGQLEEQPVPTFTLEKSNPEEVPNEEPKAEHEEGYTQDQEKYDESGGVIKEVTYSDSSDRADTYSNEGDTAHSESENDQ